MQLVLEGQPILFERAIRVFDMIKDRSNQEHIYAISVNGKLYDLNSSVCQEGVVTLHEDTSETGRLIYERTLHFVFISAVKQVYPTAEVILEHALSGGVYCTITNVETIHLSAIHLKMQELIEQHSVIERQVMATSEAVDFFMQLGMQDKANLLKCRKSDQSSVYTLAGVHDYFYGIMLPHAGYLSSFALRPYKQGFWLSAQDHFVNQEKMFNVFQEFEAWGRLIGVSTIDQLNEALLQGRMNELVLMSETMSEKKLSSIAEDIITHPHLRMIMIAGPSSAGKTTFARRLAIHLKMLGKQPLAISMDDYYKNREDCKVFADGTYDFDSLDALDLPLFHQTMKALLKQEAVYLPTFNFKTGKREWKEATTQLSNQHIVIIEGIHGLNPATSECLPQGVSYKIYINALTHLNLDAHNRIPTSDYRLLRRIARDHRTRGWSAKETIAFWKNVRESEDKYIYPYQEEADVVYNSSMIYELCILKKLVSHVLAEVTPQDKAYLEANRLCKLLEYFVEGSEAAVPCNSIFAEFLGNSIFDVT